MASAATATKVKDKQATADVAKSGDAGVPATESISQRALSARAQRMAQDAGKGVSRNRDDKIIPMIRILQSQSPQVLRQKAEFIQGAEAGDFYFKNMPVPIVKGEAGMEVQPCAFLRCWLEFDGPRDESPNFVARHEDDGGKPAGWRDRGLKLADDGYDYVDVRGHRYSFSREHYVLVEGRPYVFPFGGSLHTTSREWQTLMDQFLLPSGQPEPSWNRKYRVTTVPRSNKSGDWFGLRIEPVAGEVSDQEYDLGLALWNAVEGGARAEAPDAAKPEAGSQDQSADKHI